MLPFAEQLESNDVPESAGTTALGGAAEVAAGAPAAGARVGGGSGGRCGCTCSCTGRGTGGPGGAAYSPDRGCPLESTPPPTAPPVRDPNSAPPPPACGLRPQPIRFAGEAGGSPPSPRPSGGRALFLPRPKTWGEGSYSPSVSFTHTTQPTSDLPITGVSKVDVVARLVQRLEVFYGDLHKLDVTE